MGTHTTTKPRHVVHSPAQVVNDHAIHFAFDNQTNSRGRRGLADFVGTGLSLAFGTATAAQIDALRQQITDAVQHQMAVVHNVGRLITLINQQGLEQRETRRQLATFEQAHNAFVRKEVERWAAHSVGNRVLISEQAIGSLTNLDVAMHRELEAITRLHELLRNGQLTEYLLPPTLIRDIARLRPRTNG